MPTATGFKRVKGVQIHRPFIYGSYAVPFSVANPAPPNTPPEHTHRWTVFLAPLPGHDLTHWLRKVQFKLHETYANSTRMIEAPAAFSITETGWGEFEVQMRLFLIPEAGEKSQTLWHALKLHPYQGDEQERERQRRDGSEIRSVCYEEVVFSEPMENFFDILTKDTPPNTVTKGSSGKGKNVTGRHVGGARTAEIPATDTRDNVYSRAKESAELARLKEAKSKVEALMIVEREQLQMKETKRQQIQQTN